MLWQQGRSEQAAIVADVKQRQVRPDAIELPVFHHGKRLAAQRRAAPILLVVRFRPRLTGGRALPLDRSARRPLRAVAVALRRSLGRVDSSIFRCGPNYPSPSP